MPGIAAFADETKDATYYPVDFSYDLNASFTDLTDYAMEGTNSIFADGNDVVLLQDETMTRDTQESAVLNVDVEDGVFYMQLSADSDTVSYAYTDGDWVAEDADAAHVYTPANSSAYTTYIVGSYIYYTGTAGLTIIDQTQQDTDGGVLATLDYTLLRYYNDTIYAVSNNQIYSFDVAEPTVISLTYIDYAIDDEILVGNTLDYIAATEYDKLQKVTVKSETDDGDPVYMTKISLAITAADVKEDTYFTSSGTFAVTAKDADEPSEIVAGDELLLLCEVGNAYVVSYDTQAYIMAKTGGTATDIDLEDCEYESATAVEEYDAYYAPFMTDGTKVLELETGASYNIDYMITQATYGFLENDFYVIEKTTTDDTTGAETTTYAFVPQGALSEYSYTRENPVTTQDPDQTEDNIIVKVVLSLLLVVIILAIVGLIVFFATGRKYKAVDTGSGSDQDADKSDGPDDDGTDKK
ncbi:MAG: hypothetical protein LUD50_00200 [Clostridia bacterium]|nr:hypothetical protein [Clostridia bacterium]